MPFEALVKSLAWNLKTLVGFWGAFTLIPWVQSGPKMCKYWMLVCAKRRVTGWPNIGVLHSCEYWDRTQLWTLYTYSWKDSLWAGPIEMYLVRRNWDLKYQQFWKLSFRSEYNLTYDLSCLATSSGYLKLPSYILKLALSFRSIFYSRELLGHFIRPPCDCVDDTDPLLLVLKYHYHIKCYRCRIA